MQLISYLMACLNSQEVMETIISEEAGKSDSVGSGITALSSSCRPWLWPLCFRSTPVRLSTGVPANERLVSEFASCSLRFFCRLSVKRVGGFSAETDVNLNSEAFRNKSERLLLGESWEAVGVSFLRWPRKPAHLCRMFQAEFSPGSRSLCPGLVCVTISRVLGWKNI